MDIKWLGHSCFLLTGDSGVTILMDPCDPSTGIVHDPMEADAVTSSHDHYDHNYFALAKGPALRITTPGPHAVKDAAITGYPVWHDAQDGALRGSNIMYLVEMDGIRVLHAGDLGHQVDDATLAAIGPVDVLLTPIGGIYTLDAQGALEFCRRVKPAVVIPMHYKTQHLTFELGDLTPFLQGADKDWSVHRLRQPDAVLTRESLGRNRIIVLYYRLKES